MPFFTCLKSGIGNNSSSLVKNSQTRVSNAVSKSGPYSTGNTFYQMERRVSSTYAFIRRHLISNICFLKRNKTSECNCKYSIIFRLP